MSSPVFSAGDAHGIAKGYRLRFLSRWLCGRFLTPTTYLKCMTLPVRDSLDILSVLLASDGECVDSARYSFIDSRFIVSDT